MFWSTSDDHRVPDTWGNVTVTPASIEEVPEPASSLLVWMGMFALLAFRRR
jgi:hypothetical protein